MSNPFGSIDTKITSIPLQKKIDGVIKRKKAGRPRRPNMERYLIKMDRSLHAQLSRYADENGLNKSAVISQAVHAFIAPSRRDDHHEHIL
jgi:hypothetical protein